MIHPAPARTGRSLDPSRVPRSWDPGRLWRGRFPAKAVIAGLVVVGRLREHPVPVAWLSAARPISTIISARKVCLLAVAPRTVGVFRSTSSGDGLNRCCRISGKRRPAGADRDCIRCGDSERPGLLGPLRAARRTWVPAATGGEVSSQITAQHLNSAAEPVCQSPTRSPRRSCQVRPMSRSTAARMMSAWEIDPPAKKAWPFTSRSHRS